ncbi:predicted protein [Sclerotinia sclerotiorum 1980 UF-70]|uniref:Uncharacterized protein n=1 Tax=Sclerotinia sclerotiorum (strain ATCC 18683 / 1980 / Ss-1) TaxID=665079 RepID=A7F402_SCLS1|nr:predicted protein [Sclerotinia sclerotiorum 1980 UF-70]EDN97473.1 predicted protein [Sclerotinia sclerotiorum 1980 UF-70]
MIKVTLATATPALLSFKGYSSSSNLPDRVLNMTRTTELDNATLRLKSQHRLKKYLCGASSRLDAFDGKAWSGAGNCGQMSKNEAQKPDVALRL